MRLYIIANTSFKIPPTILFDTIKQLATHLSTQQSFQLFIIGSHLPASLVSFCNDIESITVLASNEGKQIIKNDKAANIIHFGLDIKANKETKTYFIPLALPSDIPGISWLQKQLLNRRFTYWIKQADKIICLSDWSFKSVSEQLIKYKEKIAIAYLPLSVVPSFEWHELSLNKEKLTSGNQYFLCFAPIKRFTAILKEFSIFKKWQLTTMHLVFVVETPEAKEEALAMLKGYKFRQSISLLASNDIQSVNIAASYVILFEGVSFSKSVWIQEAIQYELPILIDPSLYLPASWVKAGEVFSFTEKDALSNHFKLYYKDELYRQNRAKMGVEWLTALHENHHQNESIAFHKILQNNR
jgi:hypothetical protein